MKQKLLIAVAMLPVLAAAGCSSAGEEAEEEFAMIDAAEPKSLAGDYARCRAKQKIADGYLADKNVEKYESARLNASITCTNVQLRDEAELR